MIKHCELTVIEEVSDNGSYRCYFHWDDAFSKRLPFSIPAFSFNVDLDFPYREVWRNDMRRLVICARTDLKLPWWAWWWFRYRLEESGRLSVAWLFHLLSIWGIAKIPTFEMPTFKNTKFIWQKNYE